MRIINFFEGGKLLVYSFIHRSSCRYFQTLHFELNSSYLYPTEADLISIYYCQKKGLVFFE